MLCKNTSSGLYQVQRSYIYKALVPREPASDISVREKRQKERNWWGQKGLAGDIRFLDCLKLGCGCPLLKWLEVLQCWMDGMFKIKPIWPRVVLLFIASRSRTETICVGMLRWSIRQHLPNHVGSSWRLVLRDRSVWRILVSKAEQPFKKHAKEMLQIFHDSLRHSRPLRWAIWGCQTFVIDRGGIQCMLCTEASKSGLLVSPALQWWFNQETTFRIFLDLKTRHTTDAGQYSWGCTSGTAPAGVRREKDQSKQSHN